MKVLHIILSSLSHGFITLTLSTQSNLLDGRHPPVLPLSLSLLLISVFLEAMIKNTEPQTLRHQLKALDTNWFLNWNLFDARRCVWRCHTSGSLKYMSRLWSRVNQRFLKPSVCCKDKQVIEKGRQEVSETHKDWEREKFNTDTATVYKYHRWCLSGF